MFCFYKYDTYSTCHHRDSQSTATLEHSDSLQIKTKQKSVWMKWEKASIMLVAMAGISRIKQSGTYANLWSAEINTQPLESGAQYQNILFVDRKTGQMFNKMTTKNLGIKKTWFYLFMIHIRKIHSIHLNNLITNLKKFMQILVRMLS